MKVLDTSINGIDGVILLEPKRHEDARGFFMETFQDDAYRQAGVSGPFVQDNLSHSQKHVLRGLHYQRRQGKLITVVCGEIFDVAVDIRPDSADFGRWMGTTLSAHNRRQVYLPPGFAHGFCVLSDQADVWYKTTDIYRPEEEGGLLWNDPAIGIEWPAEVENPILSTRDQAHPTLDQLDRASLPSGNP